MRYTSSLVQNILFVILILALAILLCFLWNTKTEIEEKNNFCYTSNTDSMYHYDDCNKMFSEYYVKVTIKEAKDVNKNKCPECFCEPLESTFLSGLLEDVATYVLIAQIGLFLFYINNL